MSNIAEQIKTFHTDYNEMLEEAEEAAMNIDQDWDNESTTFEFIDGSVLVVCNSEAFAYGSKE